MVTPMGRFCSSECSVINRETKTKLRENPAQPKGSSSKVLVLVLLLMVLGTIGIHFARKSHPNLGRYDVIGRALDKMK
jgi:hypothetical protein